MMYPVMDALRQGDYDTAFDRLVRTLSISGRPAEQSEAGLWLAEVYSLYSSDGQEGAWGALEAAAEADSAVRDSLLYRSLVAELHALAGQEVTVPDVLFTAQDSRARYHVAQALVYLGDTERAIEVLQASPLELPAFLAWRAEALLASSLEAEGRPEEAAACYKRAALGSLGLERYWNLLDAAAMYLDSGGPQEAMRALEDAREAVGEESSEDLATRHYLLARVQLVLENPTLALEAIERVEALEAGGTAESAHGTPLVKAQVLSSLGRYEDAKIAFLEALKQAEGSDHSHVLHEFGVAALDAGDFSESETCLRQLLRDPDYPHRGQALADLADVSYRQGRYADAERYALEATRFGAAEVGHLVLGNLAYDLMHLEEALDHYREAVVLTAPGSADWITAQEMATDTLAQMGYPDPREVLERIGLVLPYLSPADEWRVTLELYAQRARDLLKGSRILN